MIPKFVGMRNSRLLVGLRGGSPDPDAAAASQRLSHVDKQPH